MEQRFTGIMLKRRIWLVVGFQALLVFSSVIFAWLLQFDFTLPYRDILIMAVPILVVIRLLCLRMFNLHRGWWSFSGVTEAIAILKAVTVGTLVFFVVMRVLKIDAFPRSIYFIEAMLTAGLLAVSRLLSRVLADSMRQAAKDSKKVFMIGAGKAAQLVIRGIALPNSGMTVLGCVDDNPTKVGIKIHGVPVLGTTAELPQLLTRYQPDEVLIAVPSATGEQMQRFISLCQTSGVNFRTLPSICDIIQGNLSIRNFREVRLEDLLGRDPVEIDLNSVRRSVEGKNVIVTGAAGSIGSEICRQICSYNPAHLICVDQSETGIFYLQDTLKSSGNTARVTYTVADVGDSERMRAVFRDHQPTVVFHAAAYKHVPVMEVNVHEAVKNNVFALLGLIEVAENAGCENFVLISSDKAVNPSSVMGTTKRLGELILACRDSAMRCVSVRFGNVLGSSGSVVPVLQRQLRDNQPLTITHQDVKRFFMTTREAVSLVLQAYAIGEHGDILLLDMGDPVSILQLARTLIQLSGKREDQVQICFTGLREGEKLNELLHSPTEQLLGTTCPKIKRVRGELMSWNSLDVHLKGLRASMSINGAGPVRAKLHEIIPEYMAPNGHNPKAAQFIPQVVPSRPNGAQPVPGNHGNGNGKGVVAGANGNGAGHAANNGDGAQPVAPSQAPSQNDPERLHRSAAGRSN